MTKRILLVVLLFYTFNIVNGQSLVCFDSLIINNVIEVKNRDLLVSEFSYGPSLTIFFSIENNSDSIIVIKNPFSHSLYPYHGHVPFLSVEYRMNGKSLEKEIAYGWSEGDLLIHPHSKRRFEVGIDLVMPYNDYSNDYLTIIDHSQHLFEKLPALRLIVRINENKTYSLSPISIVNGDYFVNFLED